MRNRKYLLLGALLSAPLFTNAQITVQSSGSWFESGYVTFSLMDEATSYNVYCKPTDGEYTQLDAPLVRNYGTYGRADALGLPAGEYQFKIVPVDASETELTDYAVESPVITPKSHDRSGYAFFGGACPGAYTATGELKSNTVILYLTETNKDNITLAITTESKGTITSCTGLQGILNGYKKGCESRPLLIRIIGQITDLAEMEKGDIVIDMGGSTTCPGITIEGVGNDATIDGWGIRLKNCISVEISNLGLINCDSDEGDDIGLQQDNEYIWVHNCDFFYGEAGNEDDQAKGDGALDCKRSTYITFSYNHFWDSGKCNLLGLKGESDDMYITYHHNWYDHSDSRHPRVRYYSCHVYNNYYDGNAKYGVGATNASSVFVDRNYFRNTNKPIMISMQGTDIYNGKGTFSSENGGMIKAYGNTFAEKSSSFRYVTYQENSTEFDAYEVTTADKAVPAEVVTKQGGTCYNNFDTDTDRFYEYTPDDADKVPDVVTGNFGAGRMEHGDLQWTFDNSVDDASYDVNTALKEAINNYRSTLVGLFTETEGSYSGGSDSSDEGSSSVPGSEGYVCYFTKEGPSNSFYTFTSCNYSNSYGSATVNGTTYDWCLKMESGTNVSFTIDEEMTLVLVFAEGSVPNIKIDNSTVSATDNSNIITATVGAGTHELTKANTFYLFYITLYSESDTEGMKVVEADATEGQIYDLMGRPVANPKPGHIYLQKGKKFIQPLK